MCFAPAVALAKRLVRSGVDALIIEGAEAGGHIGPVSTSVLAQEILPQIREVPIFVAGGIGRGEAIRVLSADGRRGLPARHAIRVRHRVDRPSRSSSRLHSGQRAGRRDLGSGRSGSAGDSGARAGQPGYASNSRQRSAGGRPVPGGETLQDEAQLEIELFWAGSLKRAVVEGDVDSGSLMAGQSVGMVTREQPTGRSFPIWWIRRSPRLPISSFERSFE